jgi:hypothetical protein
MHKRIKFMIDGIGPQILGPKKYKNADALRHHGYLIFISLCKCWQRTMPRTGPFPPGELARYTTRYKLMNFISTKKVRIQTPDNVPNIHNILGVVLTTTEPIATILRNAFTEVCINNTHSLQLFGTHNNFTIDLLAFPITPQDHITNGCTINQHNHQYHRSQFKLMPTSASIPTSSNNTNFSPLPSSVSKTVLPSFCAFSHGHGDLHLTGIFSANCLTNFS